MVEDQSVGFDIADFVDGDGGGGRVVVLADVAGDACGFGGGRDGLVYLGRVGWVGGGALQAREGVGVHGEADAVYCGAVLGGGGRVDLGGT